MTRPPELVEEFPIRLHGDILTTTHNVWETLDAAWQGDIDRLRTLGEDLPALLDARYDYTSPLHLAVLSGQVEAIRFLIDRGLYDPEYRNHPFGETLLTIAQVRGNAEIVALLTSAPGHPAATDNGRIDHRPTPAQRRFQAAVDREDAPAIATMLAEDPDLALWPHYFWGEGILSMPAKEGNFEIVDLLLAAGARIPTVTKWGARYYFERADMARHLLESGMDPNHRNWREFTLLHDMAFTGDVEKASLLIDFGADPERVDDEYSLTPLGYAERWGRAEVDRLLRDRWATEPS